MNTFVIGTLTIFLDGQVSLKRIKNEGFKMEKTSCYSFMRDPQGERFCLKGNVPNQQRDAVLTEQKAFHISDITQECFDFLSKVIKNRRGHVISAPSHSTLKTYNLTGVKWARLSPADRFRLNIEDKVSHILGRQCTTKDYMIDIPEIIEADA